MEIRRPTFEDRDALHQFFREVITDTFWKNGISNLVNDMEEEIHTKMAYLDADFSSGGEKRFFLIATHADTIIGSIEFGPASLLIQKISEGALSYLPEVGTMFVQPGHQQQGIGSVLLNTVTKMLAQKGFNEFCLDSGYQSAQRIWRKKFGEPDYWLKDYWGKGQDHMVWKVRIH